MQQLIINKVESDEVYSESLDRFAQESTLRRFQDATTTAITLAARQVAVSFCLYIVVLIYLHLY